MDKVKPLKFEDSTSGSTLDFLPTETKPEQDYIAAKGIALENNDNRTIDLNGSGYIQFKDAIETVAVTVRELRTALNNIFDNSSNGFTASNVQTAVEEAKEVNPRFKFTLYDDFISNVSSGNEGWSNSVTGTGAAAVVSANAEANAPGIVTIFTGTNNTGRASLFLGDRSIRLGGGQMRVEIRARIPTLSSGVQEFHCFLGLGDDASSSEHSDGVYFVYDRTVSTNWICRTASSGVRTSVTTTTAVTANTWVRLGFTVNAAATSVTFDINGTPVATITTNIPTGASNVCAPFLKVVKISGTTARQADIDYYYLNQTFTTPR